MDLAQHVMQEVIQAAAYFGVFEYAVQEYLLGLHLTATIAVDTADTRYRTCTAALQNAFKCYVRTRDYCTTSKHIITMCLNVIKVSIEMGNFMHVQNYVSKAETTPDVQSDVVMCAKLRCAAGLAFLDAKKYKLAARAFVDISPELGTSYSDVISPADVALYGGLCALASFERAELKQRVINNIGFREFLELYPEVKLDSLKVAWP